ncbi:MAG TPA: hypothetical protein VL737_01860 [Candidatus Pristimantibacillus sp.]|nr:hypothetical protein [Candidatus Pristimantibacillus sp.]
MSVESRFKLAIYQAARIGFDSPHIRIPLYGRTDSGDLVAVLDGRLKDRHDRVGFLVLRAAANGDTNEVKVGLDRAPIDTVLQDSEAQSFRIRLGDYGAGLAAGTLALHVGADYPNGSTLNGQPVIPEEFRSEAVLAALQSEPEEEHAKVLSLAA